MFDPRCPCGTHHLRVNVLVVLRDRSNLNSVSIKNDTGHPGRMYVSRDQDREIMVLHPGTVRAGCFGTTSERHGRARGGHEWGYSSAGSSASSATKRSAVRARVAPRGDAGLAGGVPTKCSRGYGSVGRALPRQGRGRQFDSA